MGLFVSASKRINDRAELKMQDNPAEWSAAVVRFAALNESGAAFVKTRPPSRVHSNANARYDIGEPNKAIKDKIWENYLWDLQKSSAFFHDPFYLHLITYGKLNLVTYMVFPLV